MSVFLPIGLKRLLPPEKEINASLLMTKYAEVKTKAEKEDSDKMVRRICNGKVWSKERASYSSFSGAQVTPMKLKDRLIVDHSGGVQESSLCLHARFGFPMIPGSAVKGAARHYCWEQWNESEEGPEKQRLAEELADIFGFPTGAETLDTYVGEREVSAGKVCFLAALPYDRAPLEADVLTCHHKNYYSPTNPKSEATDDEDPTPHFFPVVKAGATFEFVVLPTTRGSDELAEKALGYLKSALEINGIGAKTAAGYGWFEEDAALLQQREKEQHAAQLGNAVLDYLDANAALKEQLLNEAEFSEVVGRVLESGSDDEKLVMVALLKIEKANYLKKQRQLANKGKDGPKKRVEQIEALLSELEGLFE